MARSRVLVLEKRQFKLTVCWYLNETAHEQISRECDITIAQLAVTL